MYVAAEVQRRVQGLVPQPAQRLMKRLLAWRFRGARGAVQAPRTLLRQAHALADAVATLVEKISILILHGWASYAGLMTKLCPP